MWQNIAPKQATRHHFLMHQLLAFSALHIAYQQEDERRSYYALGIHHQDLSIRALRKTIPNISQENAGALFSTSTLMSLCLFGSTGLAATDPTIGSRSLFDELLDIFVLQQGMTSILSIGTGFVRDSPFKAITGRSPVEVPPQPVLQLVMDRIIIFESFPEIENLPEESRTELRSAIEATKDVSLWAMSPFIDSREIRFLFFWPIRISQTFLNMIRQRQSCALALLAYFAVILRAAEPLFWFMDGWSERVIKAIAEAIEPSWQPAMQWAWDFIMEAEQS